MTDAHDFYMYCFDRQVHKHTFVGLDLYAVTTFFLFYVKWKSTPVFVKDLASRTRTGGRFSILYSIVRAWKRTQRVHERIIFRTWFRPADNQNFWRKSVVCISVWWCFSCTSRIIRLNSVEEVVKWDAFAWMLARTRPPTRINLYLSKNEFRLASLILPIGVLLSNLLILSANRIVWRIFNTLCFVYFSRAKWTNVFICDPKP